jgi:hypothetical protein
MKRTALVPLVMAPCFGCVAALALPLALAMALAMDMGTGVAMAQQPGGQLPFSNIYRRPSVSPYSMLANITDNPLGPQNVYQTQVLPQLQQERQQQQLLKQTKQIGGLQNQVQSIQRSPSARQIDETIRATGHASTYMNLSHYYPRR